MVNLERATKEELEAALAARRELGRDYEPALVESFVDKIEQTIQARVDQQVERRTSAVQRVDAGASVRQFVLGLVSMGTGVPITLFAAGVASGGDSGTSVPGIAVAWLGIVGVNAAHAWSNRRGR